MINGDSKLNSRSVRWVLCVLCIKLLTSFPHLLLKKTGSGDLDVLINECLEWVSHSLAIIVVVSCLFVVYRSSSKLAWIISVSAVVGEQLTYLAAHVAMSHSFAAGLVNYLVSNPIGMFVLWLLGGLKFI